MADIRKFFWWRHLRAEPSVFVMHHRAGKLVRKGRGLAFWFWPLSASISKIPMDDREVPFQFQGRSSDHQDVTVQGVITYRVVDPVRLSNRVDFSVDTKSGAYAKQPLESLALLIVQLAQQVAWDYVATNPLQLILEEGFSALRQRIDHGLVTDDSLPVMGLEVVTVRVNAVQPTPELERALQVPALESIQQRADEATFQRRAMAVEKERAIAENEAQTRLELARREEELIEQRGKNQRREASEQAAAMRITVEADAENDRIMATSEAESIRLVEDAQIESERDRMEIYAELAPNVMMGLAARELAGKLQRIEHLNIAPDMLGPMLQNLVHAGTRKLANGTPPHGDVE